MTMKTMTAKDAKNNFGLLIDCARAEPVQVNKHGRPVVVVVSVEEFQRLGGHPQVDGQHAAANNKKTGR
jgi:prevent-host-death family protein